MTEDLRALLRDDLNAERPPPLGDVVGAALRDGQRIRRHRRRLAVGGGAVAVVGVLAGVAVAGGGLTSPVRSPNEFGPAAAAAPAVSEAPGRRAAPTVTAPVLGGAPAVTAPGFPPRSVPISPKVAVSPGHSRTLAISGGGLRPTGPLTKATPAAMAYLLNELLPAGKARGFTIASGGELRVRAFVDTGLGPGTVQVAVSRVDVRPPLPDRGDLAKVTIVTFPGECARAASVTAGWPDGTTVEIGIDSCAPAGGPKGLATPVLDPDTAAKIAADPRWGVTMEASLVGLGEKRYPHLPEFAG
ncbi:hypothetical protein ACQP2X_24760 [Actinoplanes sp. CA-131856]